MIYCSVDGSCTFYLLIVIWDSFEAVKVGFVFPLWAINRSLLVHRQHGLSPQWWFNLTTQQKSCKGQSLARLILSFQGWTISVGFVFQMTIMKSECDLCIYPLQ